MDQSPKSGLGGQDLLKPFSMAYSKPCVAPSAYLSPIALGFFWLVLVSSGWLEFVCAHANTGYKDLTPLHPRPALIR